MTTSKYTREVHARIAKYNLLSLLVQLNILVDFFATDNSFEVITKKHIYTGNGWLK